MGISLSVDYDSMTHVVSDERVDTLKAKYEHEGNQNKDRNTVPNYLYHKSDCRWIKDRPELLQILPLATPPRTVDDIVDDIKEKGIVQDTLF